MKVVDDKRFLEKLMTWLPGFKGYKEKELRRESDRLLRTNLHERMEGLRDHLFDLYRRIVDEGLIELWDGIDRTLVKVDRISERINHASYGYTGFFDLVKVKETNLDRMLEYDYTMMDKVEKLSEIIKEMDEIVKEGDKEKLKTEIRQFYETLVLFEENLDERKNVILGILEG